MPTPGACHDYEVCTARVCQRHDQGYQVSKTTPAHTAAPTGHCHVNSGTATDAPQNTTPSSTPCSTSGSIPSRASYTPVSAAASTPQSITGTISSTQSEEFSSWKSYLENEHEEWSAWKDYLYDRGDGHKKTMDIGFVNWKLWMLGERTRWGLREGLVNAKTMSESIECGKREGDEVEEDVRRLSGSAAGHGHGHNAGIRGVSEDKKENYKHKHKNKMHNE